MSDTSQSLPITDEQVIKEKSICGDESLIDEKTVHADILTSGHISGGGHDNEQTFDDSVFIALQNRENIPNAVGTTINTNSNRSGDTLETVEVSIRQTCPISTLDEDSNAQFFPSTMIAAETVAGGSKVFMHPSVQAKGKTVVLLASPQEVHPKKRKRESIDEELTPDMTVYDTNKEKDVFLSLLNGIELPVTCKKNHATLHKDKLGSGNKGKCIRFNNEWLTPNEFENRSGLAMSKDWKRSIRYGGRTVQYLINNGHLRPHAATCTCAVCSDDDTVTGPIRYFTPKARRKQSTTTSVSLSSFSWSSDVISNVKPMTAPLVRDGASPREFVLPLSASLLSPIQTSKIGYTENSLGFVNLNNTDVSPETEMIMKAIAENDTSEQKLWSQLEEKTTKMMNKLEKLQRSIADAKAQCANKRSNLVRQVVSHLEKIRSGRLSTFKFEPLSGTIQLKKQITQGGNANASEEKIDEDNVDDEVEVIEQICDACGRRAVSECTGCHKATYCSTECQERDWHAGHRSTCRGLANQDSLPTTVTVSMSEMDEVASSVEDC